MNSGRLEDKFGKLFLNFMINLIVSSFLCTCFNKSVEVDTLSMISLQETNNAAIFKIKPPPNKVAYH